MDSYLPFILLKFFYHNEAQEFGHSNENDKNLRYFLNKSDKLQSLNSSRDNNLYAEYFCRQIARKYSLHFSKRKENGKVNE